MQIPVRLYRQHDMDLIRMYMNKSYRFTTEMRNAVVAYANNRPYSIPIIDSPSDYKGYLKTSIMVHVSINEKEHPEVMELFAKLKRGQRCAFIKTLTRRCMTELPLSTYFAGDGIIMSKEAALKLEETGMVVEGNNQLVNRLATNPQSTVKENTAYNPMVPEKKTEYVPEYPKQQVQSRTLSPLTTPTPKPMAAPRQEPVVPNPDVYIPEHVGQEDNIPYVEDIMDQYSEHNPFDEPEHTDSKEDIANMFALFDKLAH